MPQQIDYMMICNNLEIAQFAEESGVGRIFVDREFKNKELRQKNLNLPNHQHSFDDAARLKKGLKKASVMIRINPVHKGTKEEINQAIDSGVDCIMLPYFHHQDEVKEFLDLVDGRVTTNLLLETAGAAGRAEQILSLPGVTEVHFGLNDLKISLNHDFLFESFAGGLIEFLCSVAEKHKLSYGIGGVGRVGKELLPADLIMKEHVRLKSQRVILSRVFHNEATTVNELVSNGFAQAVKDLREVEMAARDRSMEQIEKDTLAFRESVEKVALKIRSSLGK